MKHIEPNVELTQINTTLGDAVELIIRDLEYIVENDTDLARMLVTDFERGHKLYILLKHFTSIEGQMPEEIKGLSMVTTPILEETERKIKALFKITSMYVMINDGDEEKAERYLREAIGEKISLEYLKQARGIIDAKIISPNIN